MRRLDAAWKCSPSKKRQGRGDQRAFCNEFDAKEGVAESRSKREAQSVVGRQLGVALINKTEFGVACQRGDRRGSNLLRRREHK